ncbi:hypothetical protein B0A52_10272 [Exophiala mesophila]|uniref:Nephrocystin 3-like N-terminal domain-containing protein n=1 Tax=Exophiala mesophila TaxID=212818 RepID=A0A438MQF0_EXOME|nr:hypothetical protein B0A52_10272 [Exophiala mesophila]
MADSAAVVSFAVSVASFANNIRTIATRLQNQKASQAQFDLLHEIAATAAEVNHLATRLTNESRASEEEIVDNEMVTVCQDLSTVRDKLITAKSTQDIRASAQNLEQIRKRLTSLCAYLGILPQDDSRSTPPSPSQQNQPISLEASRPLDPSATPPAHQHSRYTVFISQNPTALCRPVDATIDVNSQQNLISHTFLQSISLSPTWNSSATWLRLFQRLNFASTTWSNTQQDTVNLQVSRTATSERHLLCFHVYHGLSFFGDVLLGQDSLLVQGSPLEPPGSPAERQRLKSIYICPKELKTTDIVLVHGAHGDARETWSGRSKVFWPRDFLAQDLKECSIWSYGYDDASIRDHDATSLENSLSQHADDLIQQINRNQTLKSPILFICHSLGGYLVKLALSRSAISLPSLRTLGIVFFGTPHASVSPTAFLEDIISTSKAFKGMATDTTHFYRHSLAALANHLSLGFSMLMDRGQFPIISLFESKPTMTGRGPRTVVPPMSRLDHPDESWAVLEGDHLSICKFTAREEHGYQKLKNMIQKLLGNDMTGGGWDSLESQQGIRLSEQLTSVSDGDLVDIDKIYLNFRQRIDLPGLRWAAPQTTDEPNVEWFKEDFLRWANRDSLSPLVIHGPYACGKTAIAQRAQDWISSSTQLGDGEDSTSKICTLQLFFKADQKTQQTPIHMLESLIAQALDQNEALIYHLQKTRPTSKDHSVTLALALLQETLRTILESPCWAVIFLIVDALDECDILLMDSFLDTLNFIFDIDRVKPLITISVAATDAPTVQDPAYRLLHELFSRRNCTQLDLLQSRAWNRSLESYAHQQLSSFAKAYPVSTVYLNMFQKALLSLPNRSFGVIDLAVKHFRELHLSDSMLSEDAARASVKQLERRTFIEGILLDVANSAGPEAHWVLSVVACAFQPLRVKELAAIYERIERSLETPSPVLADRSRLLSLLEGKLRPLIRIDGDGLHLKSQLVRTIINERMSRLAPLDFSETGAQLDWQAPRRLHLTLSWACLEILQDCLESELEDASGLGRAKIVGIAAQRYARRYWDSHLREAGSLGSQINSLVMRWSNLQESVHGGKVRRPSTVAKNLLRRLTDQNLFETIGTVFDEPDQELDVPSVEDIDRILENSAEGPSPPTVHALRSMSFRAGEQSNTSLAMFALVEGDTAALKVHLKSLDAHEKQKCLHKSIEMQKLSLVKTVLESFDEAHQLPQKLDTLAYAVQFKSSDIVKFLLTRSTLFDLDSALDTAVDRNDAEICEQLLQHGAGLSLAQQSPPKSTPLHRAARRGDKKLVSLMLEWGAYVNITNSKRQTPLHHAAKSGRLDIIKILIAASASVVAVDNHGQTALFAACTFAQTDAVKLLWARGSNIFHRDINGRSMLHAAARQGPRIIVDLLITSGISPRSQDNNGIMPIHEACQSGWVPIVDLLLEKGASVQDLDDRGWTSLHHACRCRDVPERIVKYLLDHDADASARDFNGCTPLLVAARYSTVRTLRIFWDLDRSLFDQTDASGAGIWDYLNVGISMESEADLQEEKHAFLLRHLGEPSPHQRGPEVTFE